MAHMAAGTVYITVKNGKWMGRFYGIITPAHQAETKENERNKGNKLSGNCYGIMTLAHQSEVDHLLKETQVELGKCNQNRIANGCTRIMVILQTSRSFIWLWFWVMQYLHLYIDISVVGVMITMGLDCPDNDCTCTFGFVEKVTLLRGVC